jgi:hypothetical protein
MCAAQAALCLALPPKGLEVPRSMETNGRKYPDAIERRGEAAREIRDRTEGTHLGAGVA